ncbi:MAG TPA: hypothetical protein VG206_02115 [Terriglobia bacterium]|nr:hypothetical protein [Terriglobia bacterium]
MNWLPFLTGSSFVVRSHVSPSAGKKQAAFPVPDYRWTIIGRGQSAHVDDAPELDNPTGAS